MTEWWAKVRAAQEGRLPDDIDGLRHRAAALLRAEWEDGERARLWEIINRLAPVEEDTGKSDDRGERG